jgi:antitoxin (DNA-binding transcriptional repressor) of toxin-antitoxin stability system
MINDMIYTSVSEAQQQLPDLLAKVRTGEVVRIQDNGDTFEVVVIKPRPRPPVTGVPKAGRLKGMFVVPDDFDEPLEELREYME